MQTHTHTNTHTNKHTHTRAHTHTSLACTLVCTLVLPQDGNAVPNPASSTQAVLQLLTRLTKKHANAQVCERRLTHAVVSGGRTSSSSEVNFN